MAKYSISYAASPLALEHYFEADRIDEFESMAFPARTEAYISIYDNQLNDFLYWKMCNREPEIDRFTTSVRDLRTTTREKLN